MAGERIALVTGGSTPERDVALAGAGQVAAALRSRGFAVTVVDTAGGALAPEEERRALPEGVGTRPPSLAELAELARRELGPRLVEVPAVSGADLVFLVLHGRQGESGEIQALLEMAGLGYTGSGPLGSGLAMDKEVAKRLLRFAGIPTPEAVLWPAGDGEVAALGFPLVVKPSKMGSTVGLSVVDAAAEVPAAVAEALRYDDEVLLERFVPGREFSVGIVGDRALAVGEIIPRHRIFDYECKYTPGMSEEIFPADLPAAVADEIRRLALAVHRTLKLRDFSRVDFRLEAPGTRLEAPGTPWCLEANTLPGLTRASLLPKSAAAVGIEFGELCETLCRLALARSPQRRAPVELGGARGGGPGGAPTTA
jgi:D-alanine-D-alanine ligase